MSTFGSLEKIKPICTRIVSGQLAHGESIRGAFEIQLKQFFELLPHAIQTGEACILIPVLEKWVETRTQTDLQNKATPLSVVLDTIQQAMFEVSSELLTERENLTLLGSLLPVFAFARNYITSKETDLQINHISNELNNTRMTLERLDKTKSDFISIAAHELKTPLTLIDGYSAMLQEKLKENQTNVDISAVLNGIFNGTQRLRQIIDDMIDASIIDNNLLSLTFQPVWINRLLAMLVNEFKNISEQRKQTLKLFDFSGSSIMIYADGERLYQALRNIVINAIKYTPDGGLVEINGRQLPGFIEIIVSDSGIGVDPNDHDWIFEKFGRLGNISLHSSGKTKFMGGGPGLGLPITKGIIEAHGGAIWVESEGRDEKRCPGTTFHVLIPAREEPPDQKIAQFFGISSEFPSQNTITHKSLSNKY